MPTTQTPSVVNRIRRHHALEHATIRILNRRLPHVRLAGFSVPRGFYVYGNVTAAQVQSAVQEALVRNREAFWKDLQERASKRLEEARKSLAEGYPETAIQRYTCSLGRTGCSGGRCSHAKIPG